MSSSCWDLKCAGKCLSIACLLAFLNGASVHCGNVQYFCRDPVLTLLMSFLSIKRPSCSSRAELVKTKDCPRSSSSSLVLRSDLHLILIVCLGPASWWRFLDRLVLSLRLSSAVLTVRQSSADESSGAR